MKIKILAVLILCTVMLCACRGNTVPEENGSSTAEATLATDQIMAPMTEHATETAIAPVTESITEVMTEAELVIDTIAEETTEPITEAVTESTDVIATGYFPKVLMYHLVLETPYNDNAGLFVRPSDLEDQIQTLKDAGYIFLFADEYGWTREKSVILTFDDGYVDNYTELLPILKKYNVKATVFLIGNLVNAHPEYLVADQLKEMSESGLVQFGCHTMSHPWLSTLSAEQVETEFRDCIAFIKEQTGQDCTTVAYPYGNYSDGVTALAKQYFKFAFTTGQHCGEDSTFGYHVSRYYVWRWLDGAGLLALIEGK